MRNLLLFGLLVLLLVAAQYSSAQTVDDVIKKYVDSLGGVEKLRSLNTVRMEGAMDVGGNEVAMVLSRAHMKAFRQDISAGGMNGYQIFTTTKGWSYMPFQGQTSVTEMTEQQVKNANLDAQGALFDYKEKGNQVELQGKETLDGKTCHKIKATLKSGKVVTYYIDDASGHIYRTTSMQKTKDGEVEMSTTYSNYHANESGFVFAYTSETPQGEINFSKIETNVTLDEKLFMPN